MSSDDTTNGHPELAAALADPRDTRRPCRLRLHAVITAAELADARDPLATFAALAALAALADPRDPRRPCRLRIHAVITATTLS